MCLYLTHDFYIYENSNANRPSDTPDSREKKNCKVTKEDSIMMTKKGIATLLLVLAMLLTQIAFAETVQKEPAVSYAQKLDATYTLALNAINKEDYATARKYLNISFVYCDPQTNPVMYADLLLKGACIDVIEGENDIALMELDAALTVQPDLADAYLLRTQICTANGGVDKAVENL